MTQRFLMQKNRSTITSIIVPLLAPVPHVEQLVLAGAEPVVTIVVLVQVANWILVTTAKLSCNLSLSIRRIYASL